MLKITTCMAMKRRPYDFLSAYVGLREDSQYLPQGTTNQQLKGILRSFNSGCAVCQLQFPSMHFSLFLEEGLNSLDFQSLVAGPLFSCKM